MSGTINLAFTQQFDMDGAPLSGGLLYFFTAGTTTPQSAFQDTGLTIIHPNPIVLDASGRVPMFYLADGFIKIRLTDKNGVTIIAADQLLVIGPSSGGGGGGGSAGDNTATLSTGDIKARFDWDVKDGFVRCNGRTIGNIGSSATERAEAVCQPLFEYLWTFPTIALQSFAKGASALADWGAGRQLILPDLRGRTIAGLDDMGATTASRLTSAFFGAATSGATNTAVGNAGGTQSQTLTAAQLAPHTHSGGNVTAAENQNHSHQIVGGTGGVDQSLDHTHPYTDRTFNASNSTAPGGNPPGGSPGAIGDNTGGASFGSGNHTHQMNFFSQAENAAHNHNFSFTTDGGAGLAASPHGIMSPAMVLTFYMKM